MSLIAWLLQYRLSSPGVGVGVGGVPAISYSATTLGHPHRPGLSRPPMSLHYSCWPPHSKPSYPQQVAEYHGSINGVATPLVSPPLPLFKPTLPMGTIHRHLKRKLSSISSDTGQKEDQCTRPMLDIKKPRRWGPDGRVVQTGTHQHTAVLLPTKPEPVHVGGTRITAVTSAWRVHPASRDDESSESDISDDDEGTSTTHTTRFLSTFLIIRSRGADVAALLETQVQNNLRQYTKNRTSFSIVYTRPELRGPAPCCCLSRLPTLEPHRRSRGASAPTTHPFHLCI